MTSFDWRPIEDLPINWQILESSELAGLIQVWKEQQTRLGKMEGVNIFNERLCREWSIETGIIENIYNIDRGTTELLIDKGLEASLMAHGTTNKQPELISAILNDHRTVLDSLFDFVANRRTLSTSYIKELHSGLTRHQTSVIGMNQFNQEYEIPLLRGEYKLHPNNPTRLEDDLIHEYCPPIHVSSEMDRLVQMHLAHDEIQVPPEVEAAWIHHRFTQIHPFQDGNGRMARILATLVLLRGYCFPLIIHRDIRNRYLDSCEKADFGDLSSMIKLFVEIQRKAFIKVLSISEDVLADKESLQQMLDAVGERLKSRQITGHPAKLAIFDTSKKLEQMTQQQFNDIAGQLTVTLKRINTDYCSESDVNNGENDFVFKTQITAITKLQEYYADTGTYCSWVRLKMRETRQADLVIAFHSLGHKFSGVIAASSFILYRQKNEEGNTIEEGPYPLTNEPFQFTYIETENNVIERYKAWLDNVVLSGLDQWRQTL
jgi:hypothetical protein